MTDMSDKIFKKMLAEYVQELVENDNAPPDVVEGLNLRCFFDFIESKGYLRPTVTPTDGDAERALDALSRLESNDEKPYWDKPSIQCDVEIIRAAIQLRTHDARLVNLIKDMLEAIKSGNIDSPEIGEPEVGIPYHKWHEEWEHYAREALQTRTPPVPVDTIAVPREVLQGVREAIRQLENIGTCWQGQGVMGSQMFIIGTAVAAPCRELLASLDAVLAEGKP